MTRFSRESLCWNAKMARTQATRGPTCGRFPFVHPPVDVYNHNTSRFMLGCFYTYVAEESLIGRLARQVLWLNQFIVRVLTAPSLYGPDGVDGTLGRARGRTHPGLFWWGQNFQLSCTTDLCIPRSVRPSVRPSLGLLTFLTEPGHDEAKRF